MPMTCNMEYMSPRTGTELPSSFCGKPAPWRHPRYPTGAFCQEHKEKLAQFFPHGWYRADDSGKE